MELFSWIANVIEKFWDHVVWWAVIDEWELGVLLTWGKKPKVLNAGLHWKIPFKQVILKANIRVDTKEIKPIHVTISDGKTITATPVIEYEIVDIVKWLVDTNDAPTNLHDMAGIVSTDMLSDKDWAWAIARPSWTEIKNKLQTKVKDMGVKVTGYGLRGICESRLIITSV